MVDKTFYIVLVSGLDTLYEEYMTCTYEEAVSFAKQWFDEMAKEDAMITGYEVTPID